MFQIKSNWMLTKSVTQIPDIKVSIATVGKVLFQNKQQNNWSHKSSLFQSQKGTNWIDCCLIVYRVRYSLLEKKRSKTRSSITFSDHLLSSCLQSNTAPVVLRNVVETHKLHNVPLLPLYLLIYYAEALTRSSQNTQTNYPHSTQDQDNHKKSSASKI